MSTNKQEIEATGLDVEEAIKNGLGKLGVSRDQVEVDVLEEGRRGLLGIGGREAVVRLKVKPKPVSQPQPAPPVKKETSPAPAPKVQQPAPSTAKKPTMKEQQPAQQESSLQVDAPAADAPSEEETETAVSILQALLERMDIEASVSSRLSEPDDLTGKQMAVLDIEGDDLTLLIGPRGETLDSLQYISRLMVGHKLQQRTHFVIDVDGYREQREQALSRLAERMASKAVKRGSPITLEAMPAHERRIIHMALRDDPAVTTESTGEGKRRRVRIYPK